MQVLSKFKMGTLCESTAGSDPERALAGGGADSQWRLTRGRGIQEQSPGGG